jgi:hypothetical protein
MAKAQAAFAAPTRFLPQQRLCLWPEPHGHWALRVVLQNEPGWAGFRMACLSLSIGQECRYSL